uniref:SCP-2 sterol transfer family protein n=1 Tax=Candidatus Kentrum sp. SD TaxID=2126332 RepID=A0A451BKB9_9GAMM|nr:MAG: hypothetical protein BECKSD772F_GA0070984_101418 [Candidatus Kentron sp. SD]VFK43734.1 MAG: hypothetical protein BECKSD772E_GA0070983_10291 [Candidatus Kentron sp. SD]VFK78740.1 MAG: hypothetical protein BECKSD772D_GA0070982_102325 [Candidatus Kentron sp. SD]
MVGLFSDAWMKAFKDEWNKEPELADALAAINFNSVIGYGFSGEDKPIGVLNIENGKAIDAGEYTGQDLNWDLRATSDNWGKWIEKGIKMTGLGMAYTTGKLKFAKGDYMAMVKDPRMAAPFVKSFSVMGRVKV